MTFIIAGQHERGFQQLQKAIELDPNNPVPYGYLGLLYEREQKYQAAAEEFQKAEGFERRAPMHEKERSLRRVGLLNS